MLGILAVRFLPSKGRPLVTECCNPGRAPASGLPGRSACAFSDGSGRNPRPLCRTLWHTSRRALLDAAAYPPVPAFGPCLNAKREHMRSRTHTNLGSHAQVRWCAGARTHAQPHQPTHSHCTALPAVHTVRGCEGSQCPQGREVSSSTDEPVYQIIRTGKNVCVFVGLPLQSSTPGT